jgi:hypothetical protein
LFRECNVFVAIQSLNFPEHFQEKFGEVEMAGSPFKKRQFVGLTGEIRFVNLFGCFNQQIIDLYPERVSRISSYVR